VCSQALRKNPNYAPVHNTSGLISAELGDLSAAAAAFGLARKFDPKFFEAHMNYAAVNLSFRGFQQAEASYRAALTLRPNDYDANLGLALAVRGLINDSNFDKNVTESQKLLEKAKSISPNRPETYYNEAILVQEFRARAGGPKAEPILAKAKGLFDQFVSKAGGKDEYAAAVKRAKERMEEIDQVIEFNKQTREEQARMDADRKRREAEALKDKGKK
jgi:tetratricopeptide (TPR) repeat protein